MLVIVIGLMLGPFGHLAQSSGLTPNLLAVFLWADTWFRTGRGTLALAIVGGLLLDLVGWSWFGLWTVGAVAIVLIINALKSRLLDASSILHALLALALVSLITPFELAVVGRNFALGNLALGVISNVGLGIVVYYLLATRWRMFQRWTGKRIG